MRWIVGATTAYLLVAVAWPGVRPAALRQLGAVFSFGFGALVVVLGTQDGNWWLIASGAFCVVLSVPGAIVELWTRQPALSLIALIRNRHRST